MSVIGRQGRRMRGGFNIPLAAILLSCTAKGLLACDVIFISSLHGDSCIVQVLFLFLCV